jgi:enoyl-CoA hydratase
VLINIPYISVSVKRVFKVDVVKVYRSEEIPKAQGWLLQQPVIVIAVGDDVENADVIVPNTMAAEMIVKRIEKAPNPALILVQVLRMVELLDVSSALSLESLAYGTLQAGNDHRAWIARQTEARALLTADEEPIQFVRRDNQLFATLNREEFRNAISVEMRDAWLLACEMLEHDAGIELLSFSAKGACFSIGGALQEFGICQDVGEAHRIRTIHSPARQMHKHSSRIECRVHGACIGSGIELPAFAARVVADNNAYFQLPELALGLIPGAGGCVSISRRIGRQKTAWMVLSGKRIRAQKALEWGLIDEIC